MDATSYLLGKKSSGGGGGTDTRWQEIGYDSEPKVIQDGINYAKQIMQNWDASVTDRSNAYKEDFNLIYFPSVDTSKIYNASNMFYQCYTLQSVDNFDTTNLYNANSMFWRCYSLHKVNNFDFSSISDAQKMFYQCYGLVEVGDVNFENADIGSMFYTCQNLKKIKSINITRNGRNNTDIFGYCTNLETIGEINTTIKNMDHTAYLNLFTDCPKLSNATLKVILGFLKQLTNQSSSRKTLHTFGLSQEQAELCTTFDEWTELANNGWTTGY